MASAACLHVFLPEIVTWEKRTESSASYLGRLGGVVVVVEENQRVVSSRPLPNILD